MLYVIGTGLNDCRDISLRSLEILKKADKVFQECYTCIQAADFKLIEDLIGKKIIMANRCLVEEKDDIVKSAKSCDVVFLVAGTPLFATTHTDLLERARDAGIEVKVIHNTSILNVKGCFGLYSYNFGRTISIPFFTDTWRPMSFFDYIEVNWKNGLHTLCLLDIKTDENRYMSVNVAISQLLECEESRKYGILTPQTKLFAICRFSTDTEHVAYGTAEELLKGEYGDPLHSLIIPAPLSCIEQEFIDKMFPTG
ncbi:diphthine methyl ester synthase [Pancytospora epiphaga]|nr:diphthine methyl ester synthase [Pancytospora epiphaga]